MELITHLNSDPQKGPGESAAIKYISIFESISSLPTLHPSKVPRLKKVIMLKKVSTSFRI